MAYTGCLFRVVLFCCFLFGAGSKSQVSTLPPRPIAWRWAPGAPAGRWGAPAPAAPASCGGRCTASTWRPTTGGAGGGGQPGRAASSKMGLVGSKGGELQVSFYLNIMSCEVLVGSTDEFLLL